jgi:hypothetical protein
LGALRDLSRYCLEDEDEDEDKSPSSNEDRIEDLKELRGLLLWIYQTGIPVT